MNSVPPDRPTRVLVVDDQASMRLLMRTLLERDGCTVIEATDGHAAVGRAGEVDVVVMDVLMPGLDGISACRRIREQHARMPVVLVTAMDDRDARLAGQAAGADDFLTKPIDPIELSARVRVLGRTQALSERVHLERRRLQAELSVAQDAVARLERLATLGTLAAGVGHELKNLAQVVTGVGQDLREGDPELQEEGADLLERVGRHLAFLGQNLMRLGTSPSAPVGEVDAGQVVRQVVELMQRAGRLSGATVEVAVEATPPVHARALELEQVMINLIGNAMDALGGRDERRLRVAVGVGPLGVRITVADSGVGMAPDVLSRVFEPYFTTTRDSGGTGLGLPVVQQRVASWGGELGLHSESERGTEAVVDLRLAADMTWTAEPPDPR
ncbi:MAG: hybrid sensor histidine kinase/response regulator [Myxococcota bacterium]